MRGTPQGIRLFTRPAIVSVATTWDSANSSTDWSLDATKLIATRNSVAAGFYALLRGTTAKTSGTTKTTIGAATATISTIGFDTGAETGFLGSDAGGHSVGYRYDNGDVYFNNTLITTVATSVATDVVECIKAGASVSFYKQTGGSGAFNLLATVDCTGGPVAGNAFPAASNGTGSTTGVQLILDASSW